MVKVEVSDKIYVKSPYDKGFVSQARALGGKWNGAKSAWAFDLRDEERVRAACIEVYGTDGTPTITATLRVNLDAARPGGAEFKIAGRDVLKKWGRDQAPRLGDGVVVIAGKLKERGGSAKYPDITWVDGTVLEVRDVPITIANKLVADEPDAYSIFSDEPQDDNEVLRAALVADLQAFDWNLLGYPLLEEIHSKVASLLNYKS